MSSLEVAAARCAESRSSTTADDVLKYCIACAYSSTCQLHHVKPMYQGFRTAGSHLPEKPSALRDYCFLVQPRFTWLMLLTSRQIGCLLRNPQADPDAALWLPAVDL